MISVPNRQLLSSGNKLIIFLLLAISLSACGSSKEVTKRPRRTKTSRPKSPVKTKKPQVAKVDTVEWKEVNTDRKSGKSDSTVDSEKKSHYNVALLIPLEARAYNNNGKGNLRMINYYAGAKMALDKLEEEGASITLYTIDVGDEESIDNKLKQAKAAGVDVIVGPYGKSDLKTAANFAKKEKITLISPWIALGSKTISDNPYFVQLKPSALDHYQKMVEEVSENYELEDVVLLTQDGNRTDENRAKYIQKLARSYFKSNVKTPISQYAIPLDSLKESRMVFYDYLALEEDEEPKNKVFLIPNVNSRDEEFIYGAIRRLTAERGRNTVTVYGMPIVLDSEKLTFDNYNGTSAHVVTSNFVDKSKKEIGAFKSKYYDIYGAIPRNEAYEGYDMMLFVGRALMEHGSSFQNQMNMEYDKLLQSTIAIYPKYKKADENLTTGKEVDYYANKNIDIIYFKDNRFQKK